MLYTITSPKKTIRYSNIQSVTLPAYSGQVQILSGHAESFFLLKQGNIVLRYSIKQMETVPINSGECHVSGNTVVVIL